MQEAERETGQHLFFFRDNSTYSSNGMTRGVVADNVTLSERDLKSQIGS